MTTRRRHPMLPSLDRRLVRLAGGILLADGLAAVLRPAGARNRWLSAAETALGLGLLDRAPLEPASLYRVVAPVYDLLSPIWRDWLYRDALGAFDAAIVSALPPGGDILDLGCGTGAVLERLVALDARFGTYVGLDLSPAMLARARSKLGHVPGARFERLDLRAEPLPEGRLLGRARSGDSGACSPSVWCRSPTCGAGRASSRSVASRVSALTSPSRCSPPSQRRSPRSVASLLSASRARWEREARGPTNRPCVSAARRRALARRRARPRRTPVPRSPSARP